MMADLIDKQSMEVLELEFEAPNNATAIMAPVGDTEQSEPFDFNSDLELQQSATNISKFERQFINVYRGKKEHYSEDIGESAKDFVDWEVELKDGLELDKKFPNPASLTDWMACSWCEKIAEPPVYICKSGHFICGKDLHIVPNCPYLRKDEECHRVFINARVLFYECLYFNAIMECKNKEKGCNVVFVGRDKADHEKNLCQFDFDIDIWPQSMIDKNASNAQ